MRGRKFRIPRIKGRLPDVTKLKLPEKAAEHHKNISKHIRKSIPSSGEQIGKGIEKRLTASQKFWRNMSAAFFSTKSLENLSHHSSYILGLLMLILIDIILIFPTDRAALSASSIIPNFFVILAGLLVINAIVYASMKAMGSKAKFKVFFSTANTALFMSMLVVSIPAALISFALFSTMLRSEAAINMFFSIIPYYNYLIYGWSAESMARLKGIKSIIVALIALMLIFFLNLLMPQFMA